MTDTAVSTSAGSTRGGGLSAMLLPELKQLAQQLGITGASGMRKGDLVAAIGERQRPSTPQASAEPSERPRRSARREQAPAEATSDAPQAQAAPSSDGDQDASNDRGGDRNDRNNNDRNGGNDRNSGNDRNNDRNRNDRNNNDRNSGNDRNNNDRNRNDRNNDRGPDRDRTDGFEGSRRRRGRDRGRDRNRDRTPGGYSDVEPEIFADDVLVPVAGILDVQENYAFVRTTGYLPGPNDVYVSLSMVRRHGLRKGDAIMGAIKQPPEGDRREKFNPLVRIDTVNGGPLE
ncbi:MAG: transcription termination factor Rho, partial [Actinomycetota bacterium]|nr:transcription termination factor Rho [Actinomycetota bacterium]